MQNRTSKRCPTPTRPIQASIFCGRVNGFSWLTHEFCVARSQIFQEVWVTDFANCGFAFSRKSTCCFVVVPAFSREVIQPHLAFMGGALVPDFSFERPTICNSWREMCLAMSKHFVVWHIQICGQSLHRGSSAAPVVDNLALLGQIARPVVET